MKQHRWRSPAFGEGYYIARGLGYHGGGGLSLVLLTVIFYLF
jgi:hypothetical protein